MKVVLICGTAPNQRALAHRLHASHPLAAILGIWPRPRSGRSIGQGLASATMGRPFGNAWRQLMRWYDSQYPRFPIEPSMHSSANSPEVRRLIEELAPDLVLVSGTDLLRPALIEAVPGRIMNLHTGISPYVKGAPNCTNWALAAGRFDLIGNTVLWLDAGIDSGNIIATEQTSLTGNETLAELHRRVMDHAHDLYGRAYSCFIRGEALPSVPQVQICQGRLYLSREWTARQMAKALINFFTRYGPDVLKRAGRPTLVSLSKEPERRPQR